MNNYKKYQSAISKVKRFVPEARFELDSQIVKGSLSIDIPNVGNVMFYIDKNGINIFSAGNSKDTEREDFKGTGKVTKVIRALMALAKEEEKSIRVSNATGSGYWDHLGFDAKNYWSPVLNHLELAKISKLKEFYQEV